MLVTTFNRKFSVEKARRAQIELSKHIIAEDRLPNRIRYVGGVDVAYADDFSVAAAVSLDFRTLQLEESRVVVRKTVFPYVPTLLSFREIPASMMAIKRLHIEPDVILADGHGYAHPYRCGFASHLGLALKKPTIGVAKTLLIGTPEKHDQTQDTVFMRDKEQIIGAQVTMNRGEKPVYVSVGHMISLETAVRIVRHCTIHNRIPEPLALAHRIATAEKGKINISTETQKVNK